MTKRNLDHGGGIDAAAAQFGGDRSRWIDLSTGINPVPYPLPQLPTDAWTALPDRAAQNALCDAARSFWQAPDSVGLTATPGASAPIAMIPRLAEIGTVAIPGPTYNEHAASFAAAGWEIRGSGGSASVHVNPNNPDGRIWCVQDLTGDLRIIDESFCDVTPQATLMANASTPGTLILKSFGKFWGLAGLRLGFVIGDPKLTAQLAQMLGPWPVAGPALSIGTAALRDQDWANATRARLTTDAARLDGLMLSTGATLVGGTSLFRLYDVADATTVQTRLAQSHIWSRTFPYNPRWLRLGLPAPAHWKRLEAALA
ncbi:threonine-phosphate decarboxylase [Sulfitobacter sp. SK012]|uniref:threonine-phosphate decarboxylase n=1 Tax=Sulfitobacter sp. SK012 TaxID=1389005 RepID=UPI000E0BA479|nr:threonine-phosphate decarboxylase [Sulfitobacter sp. SK012]AXI45044.1 threonine-phosphate decarboxylase [Sulfitobacter sp. SK012]